MALTTTPSELTATALTLTTAAQPNITSVGTLTTLTVDDITINGSTISDAADFTIDVAGDITLDAGGGDINFKDDGTLWGAISNVSSDVVMQSSIQDKDIIFKGNDGGSIVTALILDMSDAGKATFNAGATFGGSVGIGSGSGTTASAGYDELVIQGGNADIGMAFLSPAANNKTQTIAFGDSNNNSSGKITYNHSTDAMAFNTAGQETIRFAGNGRVGIATNNPQRLLHIYGPSQGLRIESTSAYAGLELKDNGSATLPPEISALSNDFIFYGGHATARPELMRLSSDGTVRFGTVSVEKMRITAAGNVTINEALLVGTDTAYDKLAVLRTSTSQTAGMTLVNLQNGGYGSGITWECKRSDANNIQTAARLYVAGASSWNSDSTASSQFIFFLRSANTLTERLRISHDGTFTGSGSNDISDQRLKENIKTIPNALTTIKGLTGRTFTWKEKAKQPPGTKYGFLAQEVQSVVSDLVNNQVGILKIKEDESVIYEDLDAAKEGEWAKSVQTTGIIPILVEAIKELSAEVEALKGK